MRLSVTSLLLAAAALLAGGAALAADEAALPAETAGSVVKLQTDRGEITLELFDDKTPITAGSFLELVQSGFYDGVSFHRVVADFMIQGGDPDGDGRGGPGFTIPDEADRGLQHLRGTLSMAKTTAPDSGGSQFFICHSPQEHLDGVHTVFGRCIQGMEVVDAIRKGDKVVKATAVKLSEHARAALEAAKKGRVWLWKPDVKDPSRGTRVKLQTDRGDIVVRLFDETVPIASGNFIGLVEEGFYDGLTFHRVEPDFMIQGGCPQGDGLGFPGYTLPDELDTHLRHYRGTLAMARTPRPNSGGCQFYICHSAQPHLDFEYTVFGCCVEGMDVVDKIAAGDRILKATVTRRSEAAGEAMTAARKARVEMP